MCAIKEIQGLPLRTSAIKDERPRELFPLKSRRKLAFDYFFGSSSAYTTKVRREEKVFHPHVKTDMKLISKPSVHTERRNRNSEQLHSIQVLIMRKQKAHETSEPEELVRIFWLPVNTRSLGSVSNTFSSSDIPPLND